MEHFLEFSLVTQLSTLFVAAGVYLYINKKNPSPSAGEFPSVTCDWFPAGKHVHFYINLAANEKKITAKIAKEPSFVSYTLVSKVQSVT